MLVHIYIFFYVYVMYMMARRLRLCVLILLLILVLASGRRHYPPSLCKEVAEDKVLFLRSLRCAFGPPPPSNTPLRKIVLLTNDLMYTHRI